MKTIAEVVEKEVSKMPFIEEAMQEQLINLSSLARQLKPTIEEVLLKDVKEGAIIMALKRYTQNNTGASSLKANNVGKYFDEIYVRSGLITHTYANSPSLVERQIDLLLTVEKSDDAYCSFKQGMFEKTLIMSSNMKAKAEKIFYKEKFISGKGSLCSTTVKLTSSNVEVYGLYYYIFKRIAWKGINVVEVVSTANEFTVIVDQKDINDTFSVLMDIKSGNN
jgi:hypothetical protein